MYSIVFINLDGLGIVRKYCSRLWWKKHFFFLSLIYIVIFIYFLLAGDNSPSPNGWKKTVGLIIFLILFSHGNLSET